MKFKDLVESAKASKQTVTESEKWEDADHDIIHGTYADMHHKELKKAMINILDETSEADYNKAKTAVEHHLKGIVMHTDASRAFLKDDKNAKKLSLAAYKHTDEGTK